MTTAGLKYRSIDEVFLGLDGTSQRELQEVTEKLPPVRSR
jgi:hypothetical protein